MAVSRAIEAEIEANRRIITRLKREIFGVDKTHRSRYIREFNSEFVSFRSITSAAEVVDQASRCDIVYFGDFHPLDASQDWVLRLMRDLSARGRKVVLALEMLYVHQQDSLDRWMKGMMTEEEFLEAIDYRSEWGFNWQSYRRIFELAKDPFIPIFGIDSEPRDHLRYIRRRDRLAAQRIGTIRRFFPDSLILVIVGESHLAANHLPRDVRRVLGPGYLEAVIVQNVDDIYWRLLRRGRQDAEAVVVDATRYCVFTTSPMLKYQAYRQIIDVWTEGEEADRHTPILHETIEAIRSFLARGGRKPLVMLPNGRKEPFDAVLPEVEYRSTYHAFSSYLRSRKVRPREVVTVLESLKYEGMSYVPLINTFLVVKFDPSRAVRESARFVLHSLRGELLDRRVRSLPLEDEFFAAVINEAFVCFAAKIVNPAADCVREDPLFSALDSRLAVKGPVHRFTMKETRELVSTLKLVVEGERPANRNNSETAWLGSVKSLGLKKRLVVERALGARLGEGLHRSFHEGRLRRNEIAPLLRVRFGEPGAAKELYAKLLEKTPDEGAIIPKRPG